MVRSLYVSIVLALALVAGQSEAAVIGTNAMARRQQGGVATGYGGNQGYPFGGVNSGYAGSGGYSSSSSSSYESHYKRVSSSFDGLLGRIQGCHRSFEQSDFTEQMAVQQIQEVASHFESAFNQFHECSSCGDRNQIGNYRQTFTQLFSSFNSLVQSCQQRFPQRWHTLFHSSFSGLQEEFGRFFGTCHNAGLSINEFVPRQMGTFFSKTEMSSTVSSMQKFGYSF